jgi:iron(III) transport system permease protein
LAGSVLWRWDTGTLSRFRWLVLALIPVPSYIHALSWMTAINWVNSLMSGFGVALPSSGWAPTFFVEFMTYLPMGIGLALIGYTGLSASLVEAARLHRPDGDIFLRVILPLVAPALVAAGGLIFAFALADYSVPALFSVNVYSLEIFSDFSATNESSRALMLSLPVLIVSILSLMLSQKALRNTVQMDASPRPSPSLDYPLWIRIPQVLAIALTGMQVLVLVFTLLVATGGVENIGYAVSMAAGDIGFTFFQATATAVLCVPLALIAVERLKGGSAFWWAVVLAPLAVPSPLIGISIIKLTSHTDLLYGTWATPVIGTLIRFVPVASIIALAHFKRLDPLLFDAAELYRRGVADAWMRVRLPLQASGLAAAMALVFAFTLGELGATLLIVPPGASTVTIRIFNYLHYGSSDIVAGLCLILVAVMILAGFIGVAFISLREKTGGGSK